MATEEYFLLVLIYGLDVTDPRMTEYESMLQMARETVEEHREHYQEHNNDWEKGAIDQHSSMGSDLSSSDSEYSSDDLSCDISEMDDESLGDDDESSGSELSEWRDHSKKNLSKQHMIKNTQKKEHMGSVADSTNSQNGLSTSRKAELQAVVRREEKHVPTVHQSEVTTRLLTSEYGVGRKARTRPAVLKSDDRWNNTNSDIGMTIAEHLASLNARWIEGSVSALEVSGICWRGDGILGGSAYSTWIGNRDSRMFRQPDIADWNNISGVEYSRSEQHYMLNCLIKVYYERYCQLFYHRIDSTVLRNRIHQLTMHKPGDRREIDALYSKLLLLHRQMDSANRASLPILSCFKQIILLNGGGDDKVRNGLELWKEIATVMARIQVDQPLFTVEAALQEAVYTIKRDYQDVEALYGGASQQRVRPPRHGHGATRVRAVTVGENDDDEDSVTESDRLRSVIRGLQDTINNSGTTEPQKSNCKICGNKHTKQYCVFMTAGKFDMDRYTNWISSSKKPALLLTRVLSSDWPNSTQFRNATTQFMDTFKETVMGKKGK